MRKAGKQEGLVLLFSWLPVFLRCPFLHSAKSLPKSFNRRWAIVVLVLVTLFGSLGVTEATGVTDFQGTVIRLLAPEGTLVWERVVAALTAAEQVRAVGARLRELNPNFDGAVVPTIENGVGQGKRDIALFWQTSLGN
jgi:hypothetical protein